VRGVSQEAQEPLQKFLRPLIGKLVDTEKIDEVLTRLAGIGKFDTAGYRIESRNGQTVLAIVLHEKFYGPPTLQPGFEVDGSETDDVPFPQAARLTFMDVAGYRSEWRTDFLFGGTYGISSELYRPLSPTSKFFVAPRADASLTSFHIYSRSDPVAI